MSNFTFTRVVIVESLKDREFKSGDELRKYLDGFRDDRNDVPPVEFVKIGSAEEFKGLIDQLVHEAHEKADRPILHIETHGWGNATGIVFSDKSDINWNDLREILAPLNVATEFNLVVCMAACFGGHFVEELRPGQTAPCMAVIGPSHVTDGPELLGRFRDFYRVLFDTLNANDAVDALRSARLTEGDFLTVTAIEWFSNTLIGYVEKSCTTDELERRARNIYDRIISEGKSVDYENVLAMGRTRVRSILDDYAAKFFAFHMLPKNRERFAATIDAARNRIAALVKAQ
ncbi:hypothetical protein [Burkholderia plantarii]|uniref:CHAT domain-containing protein n=1 Tax=Burkholderia plantarii TaxID=41899 RepID=A0A0B6RZ28_BURPL|nr:hypothetical protein [Burkholderia plantarii]AJK47379.1 hypothetical protein BGL_1c29020 [Burkholderia plantarii]